MLDIAQLVKDLSKKFDNLQRDVDNIKKVLRRRSTQDDPLIPCGSHTPRAGATRHHSPTLLPQEGIQTTPGVEHMAILPILGVEHVATHLAMDAPIALFTVLPPPGVAFPQLDMPGAA